MIRSLFCAVLIVTTLVGKSYAQSTVFSEDHSRDSTVLSRRSSRNLGQRVLGWVAWCVDEPRILVVHAMMSHANLFGREIR